VWSAGVAVDGGEGEVCGGGEGERRICMDVNYVELVNMIEKNTKTFGKFGDGKMWFVEKGNILTVNPSHLHCL
jgi:hypothetical protein